MKIKINFYLFFICLLELELYIYFFFIVSFFREDNKTVYNKFYISFIFNKFMKIFLKGLTLKVLSWLINFIYIYILFYQIVQHMYLIF